jgi:peptide chain release factor subunit 1
VISLYLDLAPDQHGRETWDAFTRKAFVERVAPFKSDSAERESIERDIERIRTHLASNVSPAANGIAIFASSGSDGFFEAVPLDVPLGDHWLFIGATPQLYPLMRLIDQFPRYAVVALDTNQAHIFVFGLGAVERRTDVHGVKTRRHSQGGRSQPRYQRHLENFHLHHLKEVAEALDAVVSRDRIHHIVIAGDDVVAAHLKTELPKHLAEKVVDAMRLDRQAGEEELAHAALERLRQKDAETDSERVSEVVGAWLAGALGAAGPEAVMRALERGQVEELLIAAMPQTLRPMQTLPDGSAPQTVVADTSQPDPPDHRQLQLSQELVTRAQQNAARIRFIEDPELLRPYGGVAAALRFRI